MDGMDLNGIWEASWSDGQRGTRYGRAGVDAIPAEVPGEVHLDLMRAGILADPDLGANVLAARWVEECRWAFRRTFDRPAEVQGQVWLVFERLFLVARVELNGKAVCTHANAFRPCRLDVTEHLREGENELVVYLESGLFDVADRAAKGYAFGDDAILHKRHWLRAPQSQFGWDWSPRLLNVGISGDVRLEWTPAPARLEAFVPLATLDANLRDGALTGRFIVESAGEGSGAMRMEIPELGLSAEGELTLRPGENLGELRLAVPNPELWNPVGHGPARRYEVRATFVCGGVEERVDKPVGFRHVVWDDSPHPTEGRYFRLVVNGRPVFCKGGNFVPADTLFVRIDDDRYERLVELAREANFNFLRVWGGGLYESDRFFDLCDEHGILVWQEFIYACSRYPHVDGEFHEEAKREARGQIRRLANHPSLVAWCGNNECEAGNWAWGFDRGTVLPDYGFFHLVLRRLMAEEDPTRYYQPSSPFSPDARHPDERLVGDQHPWGIGFFDTDTRGYRDMVCRFPNEGGTLGPTSLATVRECLTGGEEKIGSFAWRVHDNSISTWRQPSAIDLAPERMLGKRLADMDVEQFVYWAGVVQGEGLREYVETFRRRMYDSAAAIFWMFNDAWPAVRSWTIVDHRLRRTPAFGYVRRAMAPVHVVVAEDGDVIRVVGVNDTLDPVDAELRYGVFGIGGGLPLDRTVPATLAPNAATELASFSKSEWNDPATSAAFAVLSQGGREIARNRLILPLWHELAWEAPAVACEPADGGLILRAESFHPAVALGMDGEFVEVYPGIPARVAPCEEIVYGDFRGGGTGLTRVRTGCR